MVTEQEAPTGGVIPQRPPVTVIRSSKEEEGPVKGEVWAVLRAMALLVAFIILLGYLIA